MEEDFEKINLALATLEERILARRQSYGARVAELEERERLALESAEMKHGVLEQTVRKLDTIIEDLQQKEQARQETEAGA